MNGGENRVGYAVAVGLVQQISWGRRSARNEDVLPPHRVYHDKRFGRLQCQDEATRGRFASFASACRINISIDHEEKVLPVLEMAPKSFRYSLCRSTDLWGDF